MNEVMTTAEDLDIKIYYQDTYSMHIVKDKLNLLADEFKKRYNRELIGKNLGQFHNDFDEFNKYYDPEGKDPNKKHEKVPDCWAYCSVFNGKNAMLVC